jgi:hypothetical protein
MKYTRNALNEVVEVKGCTSCPHKAGIEKDGEKFMECRAPTARPDGEYKPRKKKLTSHWTGPYHASCPLASDPKMVAENPKPEIGKENQPF